ncbi:hypothetical protein Bca101_025974 [Brassica carinata]
MRLSQDAEEETPNHTAAAQLQIESSTRPPPKSATGVAKPPPRADVSTSSLTDHLRSPKSRLRKQAPTPTTAPSLQNLARPHQRWHLREQRPRTRETTRLRTTSKTERGVRPQRSKNKGETERGGDYLRRHNARSRACQPHFIHENGDIRKTDCVRKFERFSKQDYPF